MVVYADILVLVNMYIDYFLLLSVRRVTHLKTSGLRLFLAALFGGISGLTALLPVGKALQWLLLFISALIISMICFFDGRLRPLIRACCWFFCFSLLLSASVLLLTELPWFRAAVINGRVYFDIPPLLLFFFTVLIYVLSVICTSLMGPGDDLRSLNFTVIETALGKAEVLMKTDTGSSLREPFSGLPAAVVELDAVISVVPPALLAYLNSGIPGKDIRLIPCSSLGGSSLLPAFKPKRFYLPENKQELECYIAVTKNRLSSSAWRGLLSPEIIQ